MIAIGQYHTLRVSRRAAPGLYLHADGEEVLLPNKYAPEDAQPGDSLQVFIYLDNQQRPIATTLTPACTVGEFAYLRVRQVGQFGAFLEWGVEKDLLVPFREQASKMEAGRSYVVYVYVDEKSNRIMASSRLRFHIQRDNIVLEPGEPVDLLISGKTPLGTLAIVNNAHQGLLYKNETYKVLRPGEKIQGYVKQVREDGKIDLSLQQPGYAHIDDSAQRVLTHLKIRGGFLDLHDKSDPADIKKRLEMSKKTFKKAVGMLYKEGLIELKENGIVLK